MPIGNGTIISTQQPRHPLVTALDLGLLLNKLRWHVMQAIVCASQEEATKVAAVLEQIEIRLVELLPLERGGELRKFVAQCKEEWHGWLDAEWYCESWNDIFADLNEGDLDVTDAAIDLSRLAPEMAAELREKLFQQLKNFPAMRAAVQLGLCIDEGQHAALRLDQLVDRERTRRWRGRRCQSRAKTATKSVAPTPRFTRSHRYKARPLDPGAIAAAKTWLTELQTLWLKVAPASQFPCIRTSGTELPDERRQLVRRLVAAARRALSSLQAPDLQATTEATSWPPDSGWHFDDGRFALGGEVYNLPPTPLKLLKALALSRRPLTSGGLTDQVWGNEPVVDDKDPWHRLRVAIGDLNKTLKRLFGDRDQAPKVKAVDGALRGKGRQWHIVLIKNSPPA